VEYLNKNKEPLHEPIYFEKAKNGTSVEVAIQFNKGYKEHMFSFVNNINTIEGGSHLSGFKTALTRCINNYAEKSVSEDLKLTSEDIREGLTAILSVKMPEPQFEGQTKTKLGNSDIKGITDSLVNEAMATYFEENPKVANIIVRKS